MTRVHLGIYTRSRWGLISWLRSHEISELKSVLLFHRVSQYAFLAHFGFLSDHLSYAYARV